MWLCLSHKETEFIFARYWLFPKVNLLLPSRNNWNKDWFYSTKRFSEASKKLLRILNTAHVIRIVARIVEAGLIALKLLFPFREIHLNRKRARPSARFLHRRSTRASSNSPNANHPQERPFSHSIHERTNRKLKLTRIWAADPFLLIHLISVFANSSAKTWLLSLLIFKHEKPQNQTNLERAKILSKRPCSRKSTRSRTNCWSFKNPSWRTHFRKNKSAT